MEITVMGLPVYIDICACGWVGNVKNIGNFQARSLKDLIDLIRLTLERI